MTDDGNADDEELLEEELGPLPVLQTRPVPAAKRGDPPKPASALSVEFPSAPGRFEQHDVDELIEEVTYGFTVKRWLVILYAAIVGLLGVLTFAFRLGLLTQELADGARLHELREREAQVNRDLVICKKESDQRTQRAEGACATAAIDLERRKLAVDQVELEKKMLEFDLQRCRAAKGK